MNSFVTAALAIIPITVMMALGYISKRFGFVRETSYKDFNWVIFHYCLPLSLFRNIYNADLSDVGDPKLFIFVMSCLLVIIFGGMFIFSKTSMDDRKKGVLVHGLYRTNFLILGLPIVESVCGEGNTAVASIMMATIVPFFNVSAVLVMAKYSGTKSSIKDTLKKLIKNPMIIGVIVGLVFKILGLPFPQLLDDCTAIVTKMTTPLALFVLGGSIQENAIRNNLKILSLASVLKLVVIPGVVLTLAVMLGYRGEALVTMLVLFGGPVAVASYPMAEAMGLDSEFAAQFVLTSTVGVMFTMFVFITLFGGLGLI